MSEMKKNGLKIDFRLPPERGQGADYRLESGTKTVRYKDGGFVIEDIDGTEDKISDIPGVILALS